MGVIAIMCSRTGDFVSTGVETDADSFRDLPPTVARMRCPACGSEHAWAKGRAWLTDKSDPLVRGSHAMTTATTAPDLAADQADDEAHADSYASFWPVREEKSTEPAEADAFVWPPAGVDA